MKIMGSGTPRRRHLIPPLTGAAVLLAMALTGPVAGWAQCAPGPFHPRTLASEYGFPDLVDRLEHAIKANGMIQIAKASASAAASARGVKIPGDAVLMVFRNDFAVRMLHADAAAGLDAPIPIHVFETANGKASLAYRRPSAVFKAYCNADLDLMARELDTIFDRIAGASVNE